MLFAALTDIDEVKSWNITHAKSGWIPNLRSVYTETKSILTWTAVYFILWNANKK
jgi:hypothetical protein